MGTKRKGKKVPAPMLPLPTVDGPPPIPPKAKEREMATGATTQQSAHSLENDITTTPAALTATSIKDSSKDISYSSSTEMPTTPTKRVHSDQNFALTNVSKGATGSEDDGTREPPRKRRIGDGILKRMQELQKNSGIEVQQVKTVAVGKSSGNAGGEARRTVRMVESEGKTDMDKDSTSAVPEHPEKRCADEKEGAGARFGSGTIADLPIFRNAAALQSSVNLSIVEEEIDVDDSGSDSFASTASYEYRDADSNPAIPSGFSPPLTFYEQTALLTYLTAHQTGVTQRPRGLLTEEHIPLTSLADFFSFDAQAVGAHVAVSTYQTRHNFTLFYAFEHKASRQEEDFIQGFVSGLTCFDSSEEDLVRVMRRWVLVGFERAREGVICVDDAVRNFRKVDVTNPFALQPTNVQVDLFETLLARLPQLNNYKDANTRTLDDLIVIILGKLSYIAGLVKHTLIYNTDRYNISFWMFALHIVTVLDHSYPFLVSRDLAQALRFFSEPVRALVQIKNYLEGVRSSFEGSIKDAEINVTEVPPPHPHLRTSIPNLLELSARFCIQQRLPRSFATQLLTSLPKLQPHLFSSSLEPTEVTQHFYPEVNLAIHLLTTHRATWSKVLPRYIGPVILGTNFALPLLSAKLLQVLSEEMDSNPRILYRFYETSIKDGWALHPLFANPLGPSGVLELAPSVGMENWVERVKRRMENWVESLCDEYLQVCVAEVEAREEKERMKKQRKMVRRGRNAEKQGKGESSSVSGGVGSEDEGSVVTNEFSDDERERMVEDSDEDREEEKGGEGLVEEYLDCVVEAGEEGGDVREEDSEIF